MKSGLSYVEITVCVPILVSVSVMTDMRPNVASAGVVVLGGERKRVPGM